MEDKVRTDQIITWNVDAYLGKHKIVKMLCNINKLSSLILILCAMLSTLIFIGGVVNKPITHIIFALSFIAFSIIFKKCLEQIDSYYLNLKNQCIIIHDGKSYLVFHHSRSKNIDSVKMYCDARPHLEKSELESGKAYTENDVSVMYLHNLDPELLIEHNGKNTKIVMTDNKPGSVVINIRYDMPFAVREHKIEKKAIYASEDGLFCKCTYVGSHIRYGNLLYKFKPYDEYTFDEYYSSNDKYITYVAESNKNIKDIDRPTFVVHKGDKLLEYEIL